MEDIVVLSAVRSIGDYLKRRSKLTKFHIFKATREYAGFPYNGHTSDGMNAECDTIEEARIMRDKLQARNPIGWDIYDAETKELVEGFDYFANGGQE